MNRELVATVIRELHRFENPTGDVVILSAVHESGTVTLKGPADELGPDVNGTYRLYGKWSEYFNKRSGKTEKQFHYRSFVPEKPKGQRAVTAYLQRCPSITRGIAERLWLTFEERAIHAIQEGDPLVLGISGFTEPRIETAVQWLEEEEAIRGSMIELLDLLDGRGLPKSIIGECIRDFGARAAYLIKKNPYLLRRYKGCGWKRSDKLYLDLKHNPHAIKRQVYAAEHAMTEQLGHTWYPLNAIEKQLRTVVGSTTPDVERTIAVGTRGRRLAILFTSGWDGPPAMDGDCCWVAPAGRASSERTVARKVKEMMNG